MADQTCALTGCSKPCAVAPGGHHLACGELHHLLLMAGRYNPSLPQPYQRILDRKASGLCALPSCSKSPWHPHSWCSRTHYLSWLSDFYTSLSPNQICKLPGCTRHVFVPDSSEGALPSLFCGWRHRQNFVMLNALQLQRLREPPLTERSGHVPSVRSLMHDLKHFALRGVNPQSVNVDNEFFDKHPWDVLAEGTTCFLIARCKFASKRKDKLRKMVTKDHYHWKQQGPPKEKSGFTRKYFTYRKLKGKKKDAVQCYEEDLYTMKEYSMDDCRQYCLIKLCKGRKRHKGVVGIEFRQDDVLPQADLWNDRLTDSLEGLLGEFLFDELSSEDQSYLLESPSSFL